MRQKLSDFLSVDLARLSLAGWLLMLASLGIVVGGVVLYVTAAQAPAGGPSPPRWLAYLAWVGAALFFLGGRSVLEACGVGIYRGMPTPQEAPPPDAALRPESASAAGSIAIGIACALAGAGFAVLAALYGEVFENGRWGLYGLAAVCGVSALASFTPRRS